jgi:hypothetical protein
LETPDRAAEARTDEAEAAVSGVAAASTGLVVVEGTVRDRSRREISQAPAFGVADEADAGPVRSLLGGKDLTGL